MSITNHQKRQKEVIDKIEEMIRARSLSSTLVDPVRDFENDPRTGLAGIHIPDEKLKKAIKECFVEPLKKIESGHYFYEPRSMHMTIKNIRVINDPPHFTDSDIETAKIVFSKVLPKHKKFNVYFYRLLLFPNNLSLMATSDPELDEIVTGLDMALKEVGLADDKKYINSRYFFGNINIARFNRAPGEEFLGKIKELSASLELEPYRVDSVSLITSNAVLKNLNIRGTWNLA